MNLNIAIIFLVLKLISVCSKNLEQLQPRGLLGWLNFEDKNDNEYIEVIDEVPEKEKTETVENLLSAANVGLKEADNTEKKKMMSLIQSFKKTLSEKSSRYAKVLLKDVWHFVDLGIFKSEERERNVMSAESFIESLRFFVNQILNLITSFLKPGDHHSYKTDRIDHQPFETHLPGPHYSDKDLRLTNPHGLKHSEYSEFQIGNYKHKNPELHSEEELKTLNAMSKALQHQIYNKEATALDSNMSRWPSNQRPPSMGDIVSRFAIMLDRNPRFQTIKDGLRFLQGRQRPYDPNHHNRNEPLFEPLIKEISNGLSSLFEKGNHEFYRMAVDTHMSPTSKLKYIDHVYHTDMDPKQKLFYLQDMDKMIRYKQLSNEDLQMFSNIMGKMRNDPQMRHVFETTQNASHHSPQGY